MAKKHPIYRLHKIKVHDNRWLAWMIAYSLVVAIAIIGYIKVSDVNFEFQVAENKFVPWHSFKDQNLGFSVRYPADWSIEPGLDSSMISFVPNSNSDQGVQVQALDPDAEKIIRKTLKIMRETGILLGGEPAQKITNDLGSGHFETVIMANHADKLYVLRGTDALVRQLQLTFRFE